MENIIIECREAEAQVNNNSGDWSTKIQQHVVVEEGDEITIRNVFIDTQATESQKIVIPFDIELKLSNYKYLIDWAYLDWNHAEYYVDSVINATSNIFPHKQSCLTLAAKGFENNPVFEYMDDLKYRVGLGKTAATADPFILCQKPKKVVADYLEGVTIGSKSPNSDFGNCILEITYTEFEAVGNQTRTLHLMIGTYPGVTNTLTYNPTIMCRPGTSRQYKFFTNGNPQSSKTILNTVYISESIKAIDYDTSLISISEQLITIPKGNYDPDDLTVILNREMNINNVPFNNFVASPYLNTIDSTSNNFELVSMRPGEHAPIIIKAPAENASSNILNYYVGASKMEIAYIPSSKQFSWNYMHMPFYDGPSEATCYYNLINGISQVTKNAGIMWEGLQATNKATGEPFDFWSNIMGFDLEGENSILAEVQYSIDSGIFRPNITNYKEGQTVTSGFSGIDSAVLKTPATADFLSADSGPFFTAPLTITTSSQVISGRDPVLKTVTITNGLPSTVTKTQPIIGKASSLDHQDSFGYFLLEVQAKFTNEFIGKENNFKFIKSIISRFYSVDSYTSGTSGDSIVYIHKGEPMLLDSFNIRVLEPDKSLASNIGNDNSIYIQVIKAVQQPQIKSN